MRVLSLVADPAGGYTTDGRGRPDGPDGREAGDGCLDRLTATVEAVLDRPIETLDEAGLRAELEVLETVRRRLHARVCADTAALTRRRARQATDAAGGDSRAGRRAARQATDELARQFRWTGPEATDTRKLGEQLARSPQTAAAMDTGRLSAAHARQLHRTLRHLTGEAYTEAEARLLAAAKDEDPVTFGRTCRRLLAEYDQQAAVEDEQRRHGRRSACMRQTEDGMTALSGQWAGLDAETVTTAIDAFRRPDGPGEHRRPEQATADAIVAALRAALDAGVAPTNHGVRPHVVLTLDAEDLRRRGGIARGAWTGELPLEAIRGALDDAGFSWMVVDEGLPTAAGPETSSVPVGLWRALVERDRGCIAEGCTIPAGWCDVMHLAGDRAEGGRISLDEAGLGCRDHHRKLDLGNWQVTWRHGRPRLHPPRAGPP